MNTEVSIFLVVEALLFILLVVVRAVRIQPVNMTSYELKRRAKTKDAQAKYNLRRNGLIQDLETLQFIKDTALSVILVILTVGYLGWFWGGLVSIALLVFSSAVARWSAVASIIQKPYDKYEYKFLLVTEKILPVLRFVRIPGPYQKDGFNVNSKQELLHLVEQSSGIFSQNDKYLLSHAMSFQQKPVKDVMTPKAAINSIDKKELLGPLVLDDLHKTGHSRFPVIDRNIDHVIGILQVQNLLTLDKKRSVTAEKAMEAKVYYINQDQTLDHALAAFLRTHHHLFIVVNQLQETVGVLSLEDVIEALLGRKINDEFDTHEDLRQVAQRISKDNNQSEGRLDV